MQTDSIVIAGMARTPTGDFLGELATLSATQLGAVAVAGALRAGIDAAAVDAVTMGCVLSAGLGQAPARQAALAAGLPPAVNCFTLNKMCGSGLQALMLAHDALQAGTHQAVIAGGMESMSNAPHLLPGARSGYRSGHRQLLDHMLYDGLEDVYQHKLMGVYAEATAAKYGFSREQQDAFALESLRRARQAAQDGGFADETVPVVVRHARGETEIGRDQHPFAVSPEKIPLLKPAFADNGTVTAANSSSIADGAAAVLMMRAGEADERKITPLARVVAHASHSQQPEWFTTAPVGAIRKVLEKAGWRKEDVELYEINEAFAVVTMAAMHDLDIDHARVNVNGGACALGHPIGASGARIVITLIHALRRRKLKRGVAALCIGGGEAVAMAVESLY
ncbi:MAG TPA: acetyl-CoA C-acyltransferase [Gammaproteobacteria bacterium]